MGLVDGKVAFITGAARGQGRAHAVRLAEEGADIVGVDICADISSVQYPLATQEELEETAAMVEKTGRRSLFRRADVRSFSDLRDAVASSLVEFGHIDIVIANAGIVSSLVDVSEEQTVVGWDDVVAVNLTGTWNTVRACAPSMIERGTGGSIILISSTAGLKAMASPGSLGGEAYAASKHGIVGLMRSFAVELSQSRIRVNSIHPTGVDTMMINNEATQKSLASFSHATSPLLNLLPVELLQPGDISESVLFLASDLSRYITGVALPVDAGFTARSDNCVIPGWQQRACARIDRLIAFNHATLGRSRARLGSRHALRTPLLLLSANLGSASSGGRCRSGTSSSGGSRW